jgi:hypothetical protein
MGPGYEPIQYPTEHEECTHRIQAVTVTTRGPSGGSTYLLATEDLDLAGRWTITVTAWLAAVVGAEPVCGRRARRRAWQPR